MREKLIDASALWDYVKTAPISASTRATIMCLLAIAPTVDAVEVVRCKDCKHREKSPWCDGYRCGNPCCGMASGVELKDDDFCSYGERRTDNEVEA